MTFRGFFQPTVFHPLWKYFDKNTSHVLGKKTTITWHYKYVLNIFAFTFVECKLTTQLYLNKPINSPCKNKSITSINTEILVLHTLSFLATTNQNRKYKQHT